MNKNVHKLNELISMVRFVPGETVTRNSLFFPQPTLAYSNKCILNYYYLGLYGREKSSSSTGNSVVQCLRVQMQNKRVPDFSRNKAIQENRLHGNTKGTFFITSIWLFQWSLSYLRPRYFNRSSHKDSCHSTFCEVLLDLTIMALRKEKFIIIDFSVFNYSSDLNYQT